MYIADAPYRNLKRIHEGLVHDGHILLPEHWDAAAPLATAVRWVGSAAALAGVSLMVLTVVRSFMRKEDATVRSVPSNTHAHS
ncbi:MAG: hypothetical protein C4326_04190 [Ignavibacteria bacterium]